MQILGKIANKIKRSLQGTCEYCGKATSFGDSGKHPQCEQEHSRGKEKIISLVSNFSLKDTDDPDALKINIEEIAKKSYIDSGAMRTLIIEGWGNLVDKSLNDEVLSDAEEASLMELMGYFSFTQDDLDKDGLYTKVAQSAILREIYEGNLPERIRLSQPLPFNLQKTEKLVYCFTGVAYYETVTRTKYAGTSHGMSIRIAKGLYYRPGMFKAEGYQTSEERYMDTGLLGITNKHIYFVGDTKKFRIAYSKIVAFDALSDGIGVQKDGATAKPQAFLTGDGWFVYNLVTNLARM